MDWGGDKTHGKKLNPQSKCVYEEGRPQGNSLKAGGSEKGEERNA